MKLILCYISKVISLLSLALKETKRGQTLLSTRLVQKLSNYVYPVRSRASLSFSKGSPYLERYSHPVPLHARNSQSNFLCIIMHHLRKFSQSYSLEFSKQTMYKLRAETASRHSWTATDFEHWHTFMAISVKGKDSCCLGTGWFLVWSVWSIPQLNNFRAAKTKQQHLVR